MNHHLFDHIIVKHGLKNDAELARRIPVSAPQLSKMRGEELNVGDGHMINLNIEFDIPIKDIKALIAKDQPTAIPPMAMQ